MVRFQYPYRPITISVDWFDIYVFSAGFAVFLPTEGVLVWFIISRSYFCGARQVSEGEAASVSDAAGPDHLRYMDSESVRKPKKGAELRHYIDNGWGQDGRRFRRHHLRSISARYLGT